MFYVLTQTRVVYEIVWETQGTAGQATDNNITVHRKDVNLHAG